MKTRVFLILAVIVFVAFLFVPLTVAEEKTSEKPIIIKGLSIGMDINEARKICLELLNKDYIISTIDSRFRLLMDYNMSMYGDETIFGKIVNKNVYMGSSIVGRKGFLIKRKDGYYAGFISDDDESGRVSQISFSGKLIDYLFSTSGKRAEEFVKDFTENFGLPDLPWIMHGWSYSSSYGYILTIMIDKMIDIKNNNPSYPSYPNKSKVTIKFD